MTTPTYLTVPGSAELLGTRRAVEVSGTADGHPFAATLMPSGSGPHWLPLRAAICSAIGKAAAGEQVTVRLEQRSGQTVPVGRRQSQVRRCFLS
jgi:hypothetical protein